MKKKQYVIVDDTLADAEFLKQQLSSVPFLSLLKICSTVEDTLDVLNQQPVDLVFLDIRLNHQSGLDILTNIPNLPAVIVTSAYPEYAIDTYDIGKIADFLQKPFTYARLLRALGRALSIGVAGSSFIQQDFIFLKTGRKIQRFDFKDIDYIEAYGVYSKIAVNGTLHTVNERLLTLTELLPAQLFLRVHKSYVVNVTKITSFDKAHLWLGSLKITIGVSYRSKLEGLFKLFE